MTWISLWAVGSCMTPVYDMNLSMGTRVLYDPSVWHEIVLTGLGYSVWYEAHSTSVMCCLCSTVKPFAHYCKYDILITDTVIFIFISECSVTNSPLTELPYRGGPGMNIFNDMIFNCHGNVSQWQFFARRTGTVFVDVWRLVANNVIRLIGKTRIVVNVNNDVMVIVMF